MKKIFPYTYKMKYTCTVYRYAARCFLIILIYMLPVAVCSQIPDITETTEQELESIEVNNEEAEIENDAYIQQLQQYKKHPLNLNTLVRTYQRDANMSSLRKWYFFCLFFVTRFYTISRSINPRTN